MESYLGSYLYLPKDKCILSKCPAKRSLKNTKSLLNCCPPQVAKVNVKPQNSNAVKLFPPSVPLIIL